MNGWDIFVQSLGILALIFYVISYQFKKPALFYLFSFAGAASFCIHYFLLGSVGGCVVNIVSMSKALYLWRFPDFKRKHFFFFFITVYIIVTVLSFVLGWDSYLVVLTGIASLAHTYMFFQHNPKMLRIIQIAVVSPLWIVYNTLNNVSIGGILTELFVMTSSALYLYRTRKEKATESMWI